MSNIKINKIIKDTIDNLELYKKPDDVSISTMTIVCRINTKFICKNIAKYIDLSQDTILSVKCGKTGDPKTNRSLIIKNSNAGKKKKKKNVFYNQVSMYVPVKDKDKKKPVNLKVFSNGALQMTGCKSVDNGIEVLTKAITALSKIKATVSLKKNKIIERPFATNPEILDMNNIENLNVAMINSNFNIEFKIDRAKLYNLLISQDYECFYDPVKHACVNIKYNNIIKPISIFVFEKGSIIITGVKDCSQIQDAYTFINSYLLKNYKSVVKNDNLANSNIIKFMNNKNTDIVHVATK
jgi:TATA-box binding protein (TBP) (component of TFIID and TFIIIB)